MKAEAIFDLTLLCRCGEVLESGRCQFDEEDRSIIVECFGCGEIWTFTMSSETDINNSLEKS
jgi:hypothetical protein